jgi:tight adherence protein C
LEEVVIPALICGGGFGLAIAVAIYGLFPPKPTLAQAVAALSAVPAPAPILAADSDGWVARAGAPLAGFLAGLGLPSAKVRGDLAILERSLTKHLAEKAMLAALGLLAPFLFAAFLAVIGAGVGWQLPLWAALALAVGGFIVPDFGVHTDAEQRRLEFRHALSAFLDLVTISLAAGSGVEAALKEASMVGDDWSFKALRKALATAEISRVAPSATLSQLGAELRVPVLSELAGLLALAGSEGAKVRASLSAKAASLRAHGLADAEGEAVAATERMSLPVVVMFMAFLVMIAYPAIEHIMKGL